MTERKGRFGLKEIVLGVTLAVGLPMVMGGCASTGRGNYTNFNRNEPAMSTLYKKSHLARDVMDKTKFLWSDKVKQDMENYQKNEKRDVNRLPENVTYQDGTYQPALGYRWLTKDSNDYRVVPKKTEQMMNIGGEGYRFTYDAEGNLINVE
ncbi:MAG: hypothetical protein ABIJ14_01655 [Nanoarchaeota archaeon]